MPRQHIYMKQKTLDGIRILVDKRKNDGADASISNVSAELLDIGLRVIENLEKEKESDDGLSLDEKYKKQLLEEVVKSRQCIQIIFKMMFDLNEISKDDRYSYREYVEEFKERTQSILNEYFSEN